MIGDHHFIARLQVDSPDDQVGALAGVAGDGDLVGRNAEQRSQLGADRFPKRAVLVAVLERRVGLEVAEQRRVAIEHGPRCGANVGRVQVDEPVLERKLPLDELPERLVRGRFRPPAAASSAVAKAIQLAGKAAD